MSLCFFQPIIGFQHIKQERHLVLSLCFSEIVMIFAHGLLSFLAFSPSLKQHFVPELRKNVMLCSIMGKKIRYNEQSEDKKRVLWQQLEQMGCMWSYAKNPSGIDDSLLIEKALLYLEFEDLHKLSELYPLKQIQRVWRERLVSQGDYYGIINWLLAVMFFDIKKPDQYLKRYGKPRLEFRA